jgi:hypothetical protein
LTLACACRHISPEGSRRGGGTGPVGSEDSSVSFV